MPRTRFTSPSAIRCHVVRLAASPSDRAASSRFWTAGGTARRPSNPDAERTSPGRSSGESRCLELGLLDEIWIDLVPVLLGSDAWFFDELKVAPILLDGPGLLVDGSRVTHIRYGA